MELKRVLLKLSGEALAGDKKTGFDEATVKEVARQVKTAVDDGIEVGIVIGGGNFWRGRQSNAIDRTKADQIGMLATVMNCIYVSEIFRSEGMMTQILTPFECGSMTKLFSKDRANKYFSKGMVVFFAGGTGHPYFSTDTGVALRAIEMDADCILLAKAIDGVYDSDPKINPDASGFKYNSTLSLWSVRYSGAAAPSIPAFCKPPSANRLIAYPSFIAFSACLRVIWTILHCPKISVNCSFTKSTSSSKKDSDRFVFSPIAISSYKKRGSCLCFQSAPSPSFHIRPEFSCLYSPQNFKHTFMIVLLCENAPVILFTIFINKI